MKIIIYLDILLLVNFLTGYLLLCAAGHLAGSETSGLRLLAGGLAAAAASLLMLLPPLPVPLQLMSKALVGAFVVRTAFSWRGWRMFGRQTAWFLLLNLIAAGSCLLLSLRCGIPGLQVNNLTVYLNLPPMLLLGCILAVYGIVRTLLFLFGAPRPAEIWQLRVSLEPGRTLSLPLLHDTGFFLKDPYSGAQAVLVEYAPCAGQLPPDLRACLEGCFYQEQWPEPPPGRAIRILECRTASGRRLLPALCVKDAALSRQHQTIRPGELTIVFSPEHSMGGRFCGLFGTDLLTSRPATRKGEDGRWTSVG